MRHCRTYRERLRSHGQRETLSPDRIGTLRAPLLHYSFAKGLQNWVDKHNRYSTAEALHALSEVADSIDWSGILCISDAVRRRRSLKRIAAGLPCRPLLRFGYMYFLRGGFLDGRPGYHYCRLLGIYEYLTVLKMQEAKRRQAGSNA